MDLSKRQQQIFDFIKGYLNEHGYPPTVREIGKAVGLTSSSTVHAHLAKLENSGLLKRDPTKPRTIELLVDRAKREVRKAVSADKGLPLVGAVAAGQPVLAEDNIEDYLQLPDQLVGDSAEFILRVKGDSMIDAGIFDGDLVAVRPQKQAANGEIVVARVGDEEATVKRFFRENDHVRLQPENRALEPITSRDVEVVGRVVGVFRKV